VLGEGEVSIRVAAGPDRPALHVQESAFAGLWRCGELAADGTLARYWLEAGDIPAAVWRALGGSGDIAEEHAIADPCPWPDHTMNSPALLAELRARVRAHRGGEHGGQINLSLLPMSPADHDVLAAALPAGPVAIISRGFGNCHVGSTRIPGVWRLQYFNSMNTRILDLVEVTALPETVSASREDLQDSRERLAELVRWMRQSAAEDTAGAAAPGAWADVARTH
jgi:hydrogenase-1 operon protein HyaF